MSPSRELGDKAAPPARRLRPDGDAAGAVVAPPGALSAWAPAGRRNSRRSRGRLCGRADALVEGMDRLVDHRQQDAVDDEGRIKWPRYCQWLIHR